MPKPKVTVGMPAYNRANVLGDTIQQVLDQTFRDFEFIIYNDGSTDHTSEVVRSFKDERIIFLDQPNLGPPHPLNALYERAQGEYVIILHDHDFFHPELLEKSVKALEKYPSAGLVLQGSAWIDEDGVNNYREMLHDLTEINNGRTFGEKMLLDKKSFSSIFHACSMVRHSALKQVGMFYEVRFGLYSDTDLWLRLLQAFDFVYIGQVLFKFRTRELQGHFLNNREFEIINWQFSISEININRYFDEPIQQAALKSLHEKYNYLQCMATIHFGINGKSELFSKGLTIIRQNPHQSVFNKAVAKLLGNKTPAFLFIQIIKGLNYIRKKVG